MIVSGVFGHFRSSWDSYLGIGAKAGVNRQPFSWFFQNRIFEVFCTEILSTEYLYIGLDD